ncbi:hypothetical protein D3C87_2207680 [compost metagenome]
MSNNCLISSAAWLRSIPVASVIAATLAMIACSCAEGSAPSAPPALIAMSRVIF